MIYWPTKTPATVLDYGADWAPTLSRLGDPTITASVWTLLSGDAIKGADAIDAGARSTTVRVSGGTDGVDSVFKNTVTLSNGEVLETKALLKVRA
jgi:hypothetical protein